MAMQCPGWRWDGGDDCTGPTATEVTGPASLTSRRSPVRAWSSHPSPLRGLRRPHSRARRVSRTGVGGTVSQDCHRPCRTVSHSGGDGLTGGVGGTMLGRDSQVRRGVDSSLTWAPTNVSALNAPVGGAGTEAARPMRSSSEAEPRSRWRSALDRDGPRSRGRPTPDRGGIPLEGSSSPRVRQNLTRGCD
jgi:hypothetical protein